MDRNQTRKLVIIIVIVVLVVGFFAVLLSRIGKKTPPSTGLPDDAIVTIDPDTGDEIVTVPNKGEEFELGGDVIELGGATFMDRTSLTYRQYDLVVRTIVEYARENTGDISTIKFLPDSIKALGENDIGDYSVQIKTVDPENIFNVTINLLGLEQVRIYITNQNKPELGTFDSGVIPDEFEETEDGGVDYPIEEQ